MHTDDPHLCPAVSEDHTWLREIPWVNLFMDSLEDIGKFATITSHLRLRPYQLQVAYRIADSVARELGYSFAIVFPRQSGKNELQAQLEAYLLFLLHTSHAEIVKVSPTLIPQSKNAMRRLERVLRYNEVTQSLWDRDGVNTLRLGKARITFLSGIPASNVVGATAKNLLECDEAQDVTIEKWDRDFAPMAASTNATRVFWGTAWTSQSLLAREVRLAREAEGRDGQPRVFILDADDVRKVVPAYGRFVDEQVARLGRSHPLVKTQYYSQEIDAEGGLFSPQRRQLMHGDHPPLAAPTPGRLYAAALDLAGEDEAASNDFTSLTALAHPGRDSTALTIFEVDLSTLSDALIAAPTYRVIHRYEWVGDKHTRLYARIKSLADFWRLRYLVADATGVGAGMVSFLEKALPGVVLPYIFTARSKSDLGWGFLAVVETGRYREYRQSASSEFDPGLLARLASLQETFFTQVEHCQSFIQEGVGKIMRWSVPVGARNPLNGDLLHDDLLISAALCAVLDSQVWGLTESGIVAGSDPIAEFREVY